MKINRLELKAVGPFTDQVINLHSDQPGLHIIYGPNEAGKSSALRAMKAWLFGFPERTTDTFVHPYGKLLVGGELEHPRHGTLVFFRRKKRVQSIVDEAGNPLPEDRVLPFLDNLDKTLFETLYGIDHQALVQGGQDILANRGELGETLFAAGTGITALHSLLESLTSEADRIYRPRASNPPLNQALTRHRELKKEIRELSLPASHWNRQHQALQSVEQELADKEQERKTLDRERHHLERLQRALPLFARLHDLRRKRRELGQVATLPEDFSQQRRTVLQELHTSSRRIREITLRIETLEKRMASRSGQDDILERAGEIEHLHQRLGEYNKAQQDRPRIQGLRSVHLREAGRLLKLIHPGMELEDFSRLHPLLQRRRTIADLVQRRTALDQERKTIEQEIIEARHHLETLQAAAPDKGHQGPSLQGLTAAIQAGRRLGEIDSLIATLAEEQDQDARTLELKLAANRLWQGNPADLADLALPPAERVARFRDRFRSLEESRARLEKEQRQMEEEMLRLETARRQIEGSGDVPSEEELRRIRQERDRQWRRIRDRWLDRDQDRDNPDPREERVALANRFADRLRKADHLSDRLRREADRVHRFASLTAEHHACGKRLEFLAGRQARRREEMARLEAEWQTLWAPLNLSPLHPMEMTDWLTAMHTLQHLARAMEQRGRELEAAAGRRRKHRETLAREMQALGYDPPREAELEPLLEAGETLLDRLKTREEEQRRLAREIAEKTARLETLEASRSRIAADLADWKKTWAATTRTGQAGFILNSAEAADILETLAQIQAKLEQADECRSRMEGIDRDSREFSEQVDQAVQRLAPELCRQPVPAQVEQLHRRLAQARREQALLENDRQELEALRLELEQTRVAEKEYRKTLSSLLSLAGCSGEEELVAAEERFRTASSLDQKIQEVEEDLVGLAGDQDLETFQDQAATMDADSLPGRIHELNQRIQDLDQKIRDLAERKGELQNDLERMDGRDRAAVRAEELESNLAGMRRLVRRYARLQLAAGLLRREMDRFRKSSQDPVLQVGGAFFAALTLDRFTGLATDVGERGEPILVAMRRDGSRLQVDSMSSGTRDQLYLALRLAALQRRAARGKSLPFIVDDILINFDDDRTRATLEVLADLGRNNQVILFTHHRHVARAATTLHITAQVHEL